MLPQDSVITAVFPSSDVLGDRDPETERRDGLQPAPMRYWTVFYREQS